MKNKKAFTLLELLVAMAIIGVLMGLAVFGVVQVQQNSRETQRRKALEDINIGIQEFYSKEGQYPQVIEFDKAEAKICSGDGCTGVVVTVDLKNSAIAGTKTTSNTTYYEYELKDDGYTLAFCREDGGTENGGTSKPEVTLTCE